MEAFLKELPGLAKEKHLETKKYFEKLKKRTPNNLDFVVQELHNSEFKRTDCLTCGNCCKTTSPIFTEKDIQRIAKYVKMKEHQFISTYLERDQDDFYVLKTAPCSFLDLNDNMCTIYDVRPKACNEYPHTNRRKFIQLTDLSMKNTEICPAVYNILEALKKKLPL
ncbi:MAG: YkgJ family cysteine cluster protein [Lutibacter sp.]|jgi:Fe-S-cluster containining protein|nr:YkgJ family cysteine cluster protein [Lutibacter sp.]